MSSQKILKKLKAIGSTNEFCPITIEHENRVTATFRSKQINDCTLSKIKRQFPSEKYAYWIKIVDGNLCITIKKRNIPFITISGSDFRREYLNNPSPWDHPFRHWNRR